MEMTRYVIIEDERIASDEMVYLLNRLRPQWALAGRADSVSSAVSLLQSAKPDLIFSDIRLSDGLCFEIFEQQPSDLPIIFTTAYDEFAVRAFKTNGVDYLLKPIEEEDLEKALQKYESHYLSHLSADNVQKASRDYSTAVRHTRFLVQVGDRYLYVETNDISCIYSEEKYTYVQTLEGKRYILNYSLEQLAGMLDPMEFCLVSRNCIASIRGVRECSRYFTGRLKVFFKPECPVEVVVSRKRVEEVLRWLDGGTHLQ